MHSYQGSAEMANEFIKMGFYMGVGGPVTHTNNKKVRNMVKSVGIGNILLETDSPYLAPVPFRGQENHPGFLPWTAHSLAALRGWSMEKTVTLTTSNAKRFFRIPPEDEKLQ